MTRFAVSRRLSITVGFVLCIGLGIWIAGCGGGGSSSDAGPPSGSSAISGTVTVWDFEYESFPPYTKAMEQLDGEFEKLHPGVTIERVAEPYESYEAIYRAAFTSHEGPDVMLMQPGASGVLSFAAGLEPLNDRITPKMSREITQWELVTPGFEAEGDRYGVPTSVDGFVFYYNKKMFAQAGLPTDFHPEAWSEVREAGEKLKAAGIQPFTGGNKEGYENSWWFSVGFQTDSTRQERSELAAGELPFTDESIAAAFVPELEMEDAGLYPSDRFSTPLFSQGYPRFAEGKGAMVLGFWGAVGYWGEFNPSLGEANVGTFLPPGSPSVGTFTDFALSIPTFASNKDAAWALIEYDTSKHANEVLYRVGGQLPNRRDVSLPADAPVQARELVKTSRSSQRVVAPFAMLPSGIAFRVLPTEISQVLQGRTSLESAQQSLQEAAEKTVGPQ